METAEKILSGSSIKTWEMDDEEEEKQEWNASNRYNALSILDKIGEEDFQYTYLTLIDYIKELPVLIQKTFCIEILERIEEVYDYVFPHNITLDNKDDFENVYKFLEFIEYNNIDFLSRLWLFLNVDLRKIDIEKYCENNSDKMMSEVDEQIEVMDLPQMILIFLRTYIKIGLVRFICDNTLKNKMLIVLKIAEGESKNE